MGRLNFFVLWSLRDAPRQFISKSNRRCFQVHIPLPLPKLLVIFGLGEWKCCEATVLVEVLVSEDVEAQRIGILSSETRCLTWEGEWIPEIVGAAAEKGRKGVYGKILLTVCGKDKDSFNCSTPLVQRKRMFPEQHGDLSHTFTQSTLSVKITDDSSQLEDSVRNAELMSQTDKCETTIDSFIVNASIILSKDPTSLWMVGPRGPVMEDIKNNNESSSQPPNAKRIILRMNSKENIVPIKKDSRVAQNSNYMAPSKRWNHTMCLTDPDTAVVIGGKTSEQKHCKDSLWKLEIEHNLWFPINSSTSGPAPPCVHGHSATFDPASKALFVYGGVGEDKTYRDLHILNTETWTWKLVTAKGKVPTLAYHTATFYKKELYVFGGVHPSSHSGEKACTNSLSIFNPGDELWYKPIVEGDKPLPRFGHSSILLSDKLVVFGGRNTATYLNDLHILNLGFMEYTAVRCDNMAPLPRGFHVALAVPGNRMLVSGGCSSIGDLQDVHIFNMDTSTWSSVAAPLLCSTPRAGHALLSLGWSQLNQQGAAALQGTLLVFGGSDCSRTVYNDAIKYTVDVPNK
ncbi:kelch domain-containing protein 2 isoform X1 [Gadus macrocephalus]|uniref:kelch domain-containing protein 2 isoform X1 n=1 Tax=Gadus macrocephalus TaxID=80720 RepID=UPI0028CB4721|nr:kelch domain-containing protein 2 isoform X1 [Gadus macrocephalus]